jgi:hypothetical protein
MYYTLSVEEVSQRTTKGFRLRPNLPNPVPNAPFGFNCRNANPLKYWGLAWKLRERFGWAKRAPLLQHLVETDWGKRRPTPEAIEAIGASYRVELIRQYSGFFRRERKRAALLVQGIGQD